MNSNLITLKYWFSINAGSLEKTAQIGLVIFLVILLGVLVYSSLKKKNKGVYLKIWAKLASFGFTNFIIGLFLLFFTYEAVPFLSMRFWFLLWLAGMVFWLNLIYKECKLIPQIKEKRKQEEEFKKYIP